MDTMGHTPLLQRARLLPLWQGYARWTQRVQPAEAATPHAHKQPPALAPTQVDLLGVGVRQELLRQV